MFLCTVYWVCFMLVYLIAPQIHHTLQYIVGSGIRMLKPLLILQKTFSETKQSSPMHYALIKFTCIWLTKLKCENRECEVILAWMQQVGYPINLSLFVFISSNIHTLFVSDNLVSVPYPYSVSKGYGTRNIRQ